MKADLAPFYDTAGKPPAVEEALVPVQPRPSASRYRRRFLRTPY